MRSRLATVILVTALSAVAACGGEKSSGPDHITVRLLPVPDVAAVYLGVDKGLFEKRNVIVTIEKGRDDRQIVDEVLQSGADIGFGATTTLLDDVAKGERLEMTAPAAATPERKRAGGRNLSAAVMVPKDSPIASARDLAGRTVAVDRRGGLAEVTLDAALVRQGVSGVKYRVVKPARMRGALRSGRVDAAWMPTPYKTIADRSGRYRSVDFPLYETRPGQIDNGYFVYRQWAIDNEEALERFNHALRDSMVYAASHPDEVRDAVAKYTGLSDHVVAEVPLGQWQPDCPEFVTSTKLLERLMLEHGELERSPHLGPFVRNGFCRRRPT